MRFLSVGTVTGAYSLSGELKIKPNTEHPHIFSRMEYLLLSADNELKRSLKIEYIKPHGNFIIVKAEGIDTETAAKSLKGLSVSVTEDMVPEAGDGEIYWYEIDGSKVVSDSGKTIGILRDYMETGSADVFRIELAGGGFALISNNKDHVIEISKERKEVVVSEIGLVYEDL